MSTVGDPNFGYYKPGRWDVIQDNFIQGDWVEYEKPKDTYKPGEAIPESVMSNWYGNDQGARDTAMGVPGISHGAQPRDAAGNFIAQDDSYGKDSDEFGLKDLMQGLGRSAAFTGAASGISGLFGGSTMFGPGGWFSNLFPSSGGMSMNAASALDAAEMGFNGSYAPSASGMNPLSMSGNVGAFPPAGQVVPGHTPIESFFPNNMGSWNEFIPPSAANASFGAPASLSSLGTTAAGPASFGGPASLAGLGEGGSWLDTISQWVKTPILGDITTGDLLKTGANFLFNNKSADRAQQMMNQVADRGDALKQPERAPFQAVAQDLILNPQEYMQNNPFATAVADRFKNYIIPAQLGKSGNPGEVLDRNGSQFVNAIAGNYNSLAQILQGYGGYNQGAPNTAGMAALGQGSLQSSNEAYRGFGSILEKGFPDLFGGGKTGTTTDPTSGAKRLFQ